MTREPIDISGSQEIDLLQKAIDGSQEWLWEIDTNWRYTMPSSKRAELLGVPQADLIGRSMLDQMSLNDAQRIEVIFEKIAADSRPFVGLVCRYTRVDGSILILETTGAPLFADDGQVSGYCGIDRDITPTGLLSLDGRLAQLETIYATLPIALCVVGRDGRLLAVNDVHSVLAGRPISSLIGVRVADLNAEGGRNIERDFRVFDAGGSIPDHELAVRGKTYLVSVAPLRNAIGHVEAISVAHTDITERKRLEAELAIANERLSRLAQEDHLTGLYNRRHFDDVLRMEIESLQGLDDPLSAIMIDIDHFKLYNDYYGHPAGDDCLRLVADCVSAALNETSAILCRYGGEEFVAILPRADERLALATAESIRQAVTARAYTHAKSPFGRVTVSVGVATLPSQVRESVGSDCGRILITAADQALYTAKADGRNRIGTARV
ncbi:PAS domain S-box-containing protein/diguanylate cyclase (GGDEF) domain-containing protein [Burkholderia sp. D7]|nr:PAS domain S-box-containing protein/diguanylate cyclase (GGDEF) domain-containing protein [Burkholderia sp. D7]